MNKYGLENLILREGNTRESDTANNVHNGFE